MFQQSYDSGSTQVPPATTPAYGGAPGGAFRQAPMVREVPTTPLQQSRALGVPGNSRAQQRPIPQQTPSSTFRDVQSSATAPAAMVRGTPQQGFLSPLGQQYRVLPAGAAAPQAGFSQLRSPVGTPLVQSRVFEPARTEAAFAQVRSPVGTPLVQSRVVEPIWAEAGMFREQRGGGRSNLGPSRVPLQQRVAPGMASAAPAGRRLGAGMALSPGAQTRTLMLGPAAPAGALSPLAQSRVLSVAQASSPARVLRTFISSPSQLAGRVLEGYGDYRLPGGYAVVQAPTQRQHEPVDILDDLQMTLNNLQQNLPPSPANTFPEFLSAVINRKIVPAGCYYNETRIDTSRFWETRRVQNALRRVVESLQEHYAPRNSSGVLERLSAESLSSCAFIDLNNWACKNYTTLGYAGPHEFAAGLDQNAFIEAMNGLELWPPEMHPDDHVEVFLAYMASSALTVKGFARGQSQPRELTKALVREGLSNVPFNLPDFPVPMMLLERTDNAFDKVNGQYNPGIVDQCAQEVARTFARSGRDAVKDFYLTELLSVEEIQIALTALYPLDMVDKACCDVVAKTSHLFTPTEWDNLVHKVRMDKSLHEIEMQDDDHDDPAPAPQLDTPPRPAWTGDAPLQAYRVEPPANDQQQPEFLQAYPTVNAPLASGYESPPVGYMGYGQPRLNSGHNSPELPGNYRLLPTGARTEPMQRREIAEEPVLPLQYLPREAPASSPSSWRRKGDAHKVNWSSSEYALGSSPEQSGHQADEGAGTPQHSGVDIRSPGTADPALDASANSHLTAAETLRPDDPLLWISLEMQRSDTKCSGPYLLRAFERCCQIHEANLQRPSEAPTA